MKFVGSTQVPGVLLLLFVMLDTALWRELTPTQTFIWVSRRQLTPAFWSNKWVTLGVDYQDPLLSHDPNGRLVGAKSFFLWFLRCNCICRSPELELTFTDTSLSHDVLPEFGHHPKHSHDKTDLPNYLMI